MTAEPYASARRVFWVVDNGTIHRGQPAIDRLQGAWPNLVLVHLPRHASWLNQIEIYFSVLARKALTPATSPTSTSSPSASSASKPSSPRPLGPSTGPSPAKTSTPSWTASISAADSHRPPERTSVSRY